MLALELSVLHSRFHGLKSVVVGFGPNEGDDEERDRFWNDMDRTLESVVNEYRLCILGNLNGWKGDMTRVGITVLLDF